MRKTLEFRRRTSFICTERGDDTTAKMECFWYDNKHGLITKELN